MVEGEPRDEVEEISPPRKIKVYIVVFHDYEQDKILGVFSLRERAENRLKSARERWEQMRRDMKGVVSSREWDEVCDWMGSDIDEWPVQ